MKKVRLGLIGAGSIVQLRHLPFLRNYSEVEVVAIADIDRVKAVAIAERFGIKHPYRQAEDLLGRDDIDAVLISTPNNSHLSMVLAAFSAGKHVLVERPLARNYSEAKRMVRAAERSHCSLMVAMNHRFRPDSLILQNLISKGELGKVYHIRAGWMRKQGSKRRSSWMLKRLFSGGGVMMDLGIQMLDLSLWMMGMPEVECVFARQYNYILQAEVEDYINVCLMLKGDASLSLESGWEIPATSSIAYTVVHGEAGTAWLNPLVIHRMVRGELIEINPGKQHSPMELYIKSYENEMRHFVESVRDGREPVCSGREGLEVMKVVDMIYKSAETGREVFPGDISW